jgi:hypothetical protein
MIVTTIDPVTGSRVADLEHHPYVIEGSGMAALKIYFESEVSKQAYLSAQPEQPGYFADMDADPDAPADL